MRDYDAIVIGSGAGGLTAALALARAGRRVVVFEQHYLPGATASPSRCRASLQSWGPLRRRARPRRGAAAHLRGSRRRQRPGLPRAQPRRLRPRGRRRRPVRHPEGQGPVRREVEAALSRRGRRHRPLLRPRSAGWSTSSATAAPDPRARRRGQAGAAHADRLAATGSARSAISSTAAPTIRSCGRSSPSKRATTAWRRRARRRRCTPASRATTSTAAAIRAAVATRSPRRSCGRSACTAARSCCAPRSIASSIEDETVLGVRLADGREVRADIVVSNADPGCDLGPARAAGARRLACSAIASSACATRYRRSASSWPSTWTCAPPASTPGNIWFSRTTDIDAAYAFAERRRAHGPGDDSRSLLQRHDAEGPVAAPATGCTPSRRWRSRRSSPFARWKDTVRRASAAKTTRGSRRELDRAHPRRRRVLRSGAARAHGVPRPRHAAHQRALSCTRRAAASTEPRRRSATWARSASRWRRTSGASIQCGASTIAPGINGVTNSGLERRGRRARLQPRRPAHGDRPDRSASIRRRTRRPGPRSCAPRAGLRSAGQASSPPAEVSVVAVVDHLEPAVPSCDPSSIP